MDTRGGVAMFQIVLPVVGAVIALAAVVLFAMNRVEKAEAPLRAIEESLAETGIDAASPEEKVAALAQDRKEIEQALANSDVPGDGLANRVTSLATERKQLNRELNSAQARIRTLESAVAAGEGSEERLSALTETQSRLATELETARSEKERIEGELAGLRATLGAAGKDEGEVKERITTLQDELEILRAENDRLTAENERLVAEALKTDAKLAALAAKVQTQPDAATSYTIYFGSGNFELTPVDRAAIAQAVRAVKSLGKNRILVTGYADSWGGPRFNLNLSSIRADVVIAALREELEKQDTTNIAVEKQAKGETDLPIATPDQTREAENRRVDIEIE